MEWDFSFAAWIRKKARNEAASMIGIGGRITSITRHPSDEHLMITFTPTTGSPIIFDAGIVPEGKDGETPELRVDEGILQIRFPSDPPGEWTDLHEFPEISSLSNADIQEILNNI